MWRRTLVCALAVLWAVVSIGMVEAKTTKSKKSRSATKAPKGDPPPAEEAVELRPHETIDLPAPLTRVAVGGSGKYLAAVVPDRKKIIVVDVAAKKIVKQIAVDDDDVQIAAGETRLVVLQCGKRVLARYKLADGEREQTLACPEYRAVAMGCSSEGPLLALGDQFEVVDLKTLKPTGVATKVPQAQSNRNLVASAMGTIFCSWSDTTSPSGVAIFELTGGALESNYAHKSAGHVLPAADGQAIYTGLGPYSVDAKPLDKSLDKHKASHPTNVYIPAATGPFYLMFSQPSAGRSKEKGPWRLALHCQNAAAPLLTLSDVHAPSIPRDIHSNQIPKLALEQRMFLLPAIDALVTVPEGANQLLIQRFNIREELDRQGEDYLFVSSAPPREFVRGQTIKYPIEVVCKRGPAAFTLELGPPDMKVSAEGVLTWKVPSKFDDHEVAATVNIRDTAGQEIVHTVRLEDRPPKRTELARSERGHRATDADDRSESPARPPVRPKERPSRKPPAEPPSAEQPLPPAKQPGATAKARSVKRETGPLTGNPQQGWQWSGRFPVFVRDPHGMIVAVLSGDKLFAISADGTPSTEPVTMPGTYAYAGMRGDRLIGVRGAGSQLDVVDPQGNLVRQVALKAHRPFGLALHPHKPICYVALDRPIGALRGEYVVVSEETGLATTGEEQFAQTMEIDPSGRYLIASYFQAIHVADRLVVTRGGSGPRTPVSPRPGPKNPGAKHSSPKHPTPGRNHPGAAPPQSGLELHVRQEFVDLAVALIYDLENPQAPTIYGGRSLKQMRYQGLRISYDGRQFATVQNNQGQTKLVGCDLMDRKADLIRYAGGGDAANAAEFFDLGFHPFLPLAVVATKDSVRFCDLHGKPLAGKEPITIATAPNCHIDRALFSTDGQHLVVVSSSDSSNHFVSQVSVPLSSEEQAATRERRSAPPPKFNERLVPLAELNALAGGLPKARSAAEITAEYSDGVVIVQGANSTGTGFVVGSSGLVLTAAHCVSPLEDIEVVYHPAGRPDERKTAEATILRRDKKADLALLRIDVDEPLHALLLADPLDAKGGEEVTVIANPALGNEVLENTVTTGIVSNAKRKIENNSYIQSSAAVNPGSSGGPMFDRNGRVIGLVVLKAGIEGTGFAVPMVDVCRFLARLTQFDGASGQLRRKWIDSSGKRETDARLMRFDADSATLAAGSDKQGKKRPLADLSAGDQKLLELLRTSN